MRELWRRLQVLFHPRRFQRELEEEMRFHLDQQAADGLEDGFSAEEASRQAAIQFGNSTLLAEASRESWGWGWLERFLQDLRYAVRMLRKYPSFSAIVILILALGIGTNTAMFSGMHALILNPFPFPEPDRIVSLDARHVSGNNSATGFRDFLDWRAQNTVFEEMAILPWPAGYTLTGQGEPQRVTAALTTHGFSRVLGIQPALGRFFSAGEDAPGAPRVVVLNYAAWQQRYAGSRDVLGRTVVLDGVPHTIVGVLPDRFALPGVPTAEFWMPLRENGSNSRLQHQYGVVARMKPGISMERAQADMTTIAKRLEQAYPDSNKGWGVKVLRLRDLILDMAAKPILVLVCSVLFVLVLACANVAGMLLARGSARAKEMAIRSSLGAGRGRIMRQVLTESVLLALAGGSLGIVFANWLMAITRSVSPSDLALDAVLRLDWRVLLFALILSICTGVAFGVVPAWYASRIDLAAMLKGGTTRRGERSRSRILGVIVSGEAALSVVLLVVASLLAKDLALLIRTNIGIRIEHVLTFAIDLPRMKYPTGPKSTKFYEDLLARLRQIPGAEAAGGTDTLPMTGAYSGGPFEIEGRSKPADWMETTSQYVVSTPGYLDAMGIPLLAGRGFSEADTAAAPPVILINEELARRYFPGDSPIGHRIRQADHWRTIVGVAGSVKRFSRAKAANPQIFLPVTQSPEGSLWIAVRTAGDPAQSARKARDVVRELDPDLPVIRLGTMRDVQHRSFNEERIMTVMLGGFAGFALLIAAIGIYGVIAWSVSQRTHEIGVRLALGASFRDVVTMILRNGVALAAAGAILGVPLGLGAAKLMASLLYGVSPSDLTVFTAVPALMIGVAVVASFLPARRAAKLDPMSALRVE